MTEPRHIKSKRWAAACVVLTAAVLIPQLVSGEFSLYSVLFYLVVGAVFLADFLAIRRNEQAK